MLCCFLNGCATMQHNYVPKVERIDFPAKNKETTRFIGDAMLIQGFAATIDCLHVLQPASGMAYDISSGLYPKVGFEGTKVFFSPRGMTGQVTKAALADPFKGLMVDLKDNNQVCVITIFNALACYDAPYKIEKRASVDVESFQKTLYFSGVEGDSALFMYTETLNGHVTHTHNVKYDMNKNTTIGYRGAKIHIIEVSNESITYEVLSNFPERE